LIRYLCATIYLLSLSLGLPLSADPMSTRPLVFVTADWPPFSRVEGSKVLGGFELAVMQEFAKRAGLRLEAKGCPWKRCLFMLQSGQADIAMSLVYSTERAKFLYFLQPANESPTTWSYYRQKNSTQRVEAHSDLRSLKIGVRSGYVYYEKFANDLSLNTYGVESSEQLIHMLLSGRIDTFIHREILADYLIDKLQVGDRIEKHDYKHSDVSFDHLGLSRLSRFADQLFHFERIFKNMQSEGLIAKIYAQEVVHGK